MAAKIKLATFITACLLCAFSAQAQDFRFDSTMSRAVLENYLERSISFTELLHDDLTKPRNHRGVDPRDNLRLILETKAKFVGRALMVWGREKELLAFLETAKPYADALHKADPEIILQAAAFEIVTQGVEAISIPERVFQEFGLPVETRTFRYADMLYPDGRFVNHWGRGSVPARHRLCHGMKNCRALRCFWLLSGDTRCFPQTLNDTCETSPQRLRDSARCRRCSASVGSPLESQSGRIEAVRLCRHDGPAGRASV